MSFDSIIGHDHPKVVLNAAILGGRIAHAYLFQGEAHIGKSMMAAAFAKTALCPQRPGRPESAGRSETLSCDRCSSCRAVESGTHPDFHVIRPDGVQIKIGQIRELQNAIAYKPLIGPRKWFILDDAEAMNLEAANSFLKTLEEPPDYSTLVLVTSRPQMLLPTIRSRCQAVRFSLPPRQQVSRWLQEQRRISPQESEALTGLAMGKIGLAAMADPTALKAERDRILTALSEERLMDPHEVFNSSEELASTQEQLAKALEMIEIWLRDVLISRHGAEPSFLIYPDLQEQTRRWSRRMPPEQILELLSIIQMLQRGATRNLNPPLVMETVLLRLRDGIACASPPA